MESIKPTKSSFAAIAVPHKKQTEYLVEGMPTIRIRVGATGKLGFSLRTRVNGKSTRVSMDVKELSKSGLMAAMLDAKGHAEIEADVGVTNLQTVGDSVIANSGIAEGTKRNYRNSLERLIEFMGTRLTGNAGELLETHRRISEAYGPVSANNALKFYRRVLNYANAAYGTKIDWPTDKLRVLGIWNREKPREGRAQFSDLPAIWEAADAMPDPWNRLTMLYLLTGLRNTEPFKAKVEGDDLVIEDTKNNTTHRLPLTDTIKRLFGDGFSVKNGRHVTERLEGLTGIHLTPHDLRRTFAAIANHAGVPDYTISMLMNHKKTDITGRYVGRNRNTMELALITIEEALENLCEVPVEPVWDADDMSMAARLDRLKKARERSRERARKRRESGKRAPHEDHGNGL
jgi:integrase